jgi:hypothetical protein
MIVMGETENIPIAQNSQRYTIYIEGEIRYLHEDLSGLMTKHRG